MTYLRSIFTTVFLFNFVLQITQEFELQNVSPRTCIIGAGVSGLVTGRYLKDYNMNFTIFEASQNIGGVWHFDPRVGVDEDGIPIFSRMYKNLRTSTTSHFTEFTDFPFPEGMISHPSFECIYKYFSSFATKFGLLQHIQFRRLVTSVKRLENHWQLTYYRGDTRDTVSEACDYIVIATGFYSDPVWPDIEGADIFQGPISHSSTYRGETDVYRNRRVLIVGAGLSALDLATQISKVASKLIHSHHKVMNLPVHEKSYVKKPDIKSFTQNGVIFIDGSYEEVDFVIYCTGYLIRHSFLDDSSGLVRTGKFILPLYRKIVNIKHPSMLFIGISRGNLHRYLDSQGNYAASLIARRFQLPSEDEMMRSWIDEANKIPNIEVINTVQDPLAYYYDDLPQEAGIPTIPPVFPSMYAYSLAIRPYSFVNERDYEWRVIDDHNFDRIYVGPRELTCPIE